MIGDKKEERGRAGEKEDWRRGGKGQGKTKVRTEGEN